MSCLALAEAPVVMGAADEGKANNVLVTPPAAAAAHGPGIKAWWNLQTQSSTEEVRDGTFYFILYVGLYINM